MIRPRRALMANWAMSFDFRQGVFVHVAGHDTTKKTRRKLAASSCVGKSFTYIEGCASTHVLL